MYNHSFCVHTFVITIRVCQQFVPECATHPLFLQVANKLLNLHVHLKDLGHPQYPKPTEIRHLECKTHSEGADGEVHCIYTVYACTLYRLSTIVQQLKYSRETPQIMRQNGTHNSTKQTFKNATSKVIIKLFTYCTFCHTYYMYVRVV